MVRERMWAAAAAAMLNVLTLRALAPPPLPACDTPVPSQVRVDNCRLSATLAQALSISPTLRQEFEEIAARQGIIYVVTARYASVAHKDVRAVLSHHVTVAGPIRILRITMAFDYGKQAIATLAHELCHALEVLRDPDVRSEAAVDALFERIGQAVGYGVFETKEAVATQDAVERELMANARR